MAKDPVGFQWQAALLRDNPFRVVPPRSPRLAVWADMKKVRRQLDGIFGEALTSSANQLVAIFGDWGGGKTHAAQWYRMTERIPVKPRVRRTHALYLRMPKRAESAVQDFYHILLDMVGVSAVGDAVAESIGESGEETVRQRLDELADTQTISQALFRLGARREPDAQQLLEAYFLDGCTRAELRKLGLARNIGRTDQPGVLAAALQCLIGLEESESIDHHSRVILWIDEIEDLLYFSSRYHRPFTQGLRDLFDRLSAFFTLVLNATFSLPETEKSLSAILGSALLSRITHRIALEEPTVDDAIVYMRDLLGEFRSPDAPEDLEGLYPFTEEAIVKLVRLLENRRPRTINEACAQLISTAIQDGTVKGKGQGQITPDYVTSVCGESPQEE